MNTHTNFLMHRTGTLPHIESGSKQSSPNAGHDGVLVKLMLAIASLFELAAALDSEAFSL